MNKIGLSVRIIFFRSKNKKGRYRRSMSTCRHTHTLYEMLGRLTLLVTHRFTGISKKGNEVVTFEHNNNI